jgi:hypothetical protein
MITCTRPLFIVEKDTDIYLHVNIIFYEKLCMGLDSDKHKTDTVHWMAASSNHVQRMVRIMSISS